MPEPQPVVKRSDEVEYDPVDAAPGMKRGVLIGPDEDAPNFAMRRFVLDAGASVPRHTNEVEHEQYVLSGEYVVGIGSDGESEEYTISAGDSLLIPAGAVHWYRNESDEPGSFICVVPNGDDEIRLADE